MTNLSEENHQLKTKLSGALRELDNVTDQLAKAQEIGTKLKNQLDEKKHSEQLAGWAIDRAIETAKLSDASTDIISTAQSYCDWVMETSAEEISP